MKEISICADLMAYIDEVGGGRVGGVPLYPATGWRLGVAVVAMEG